MTPHERARELAAIALDFELTADEREELDDHVAECHDCRAYAAAVVADASRLTALPSVDAPGRVRAAVRAGRSPSRLAVYMPLAAALTIGALTIVPLGVGALLLGGGLGLGWGSGAGAPGTVTPGSGASPSAEPTGPAATAIPGGSAAPSAAASSAPSVEPSPGPPLVADWQRVADPAVPEDPAILSAAVAAPEGGFVAVGETCPVSGAPCGPVVLTSSDGKSWVRLATDPAIDTPAPPAGWRSGMRDAAASESLVVAVGASGAGGVGSETQAVTWRSNDGRSWILAPLASGGDGAWLTAIIPEADGGFIAVGGAAVDGTIEARVWRSPDGDVWTVVTDERGSGVFDAGVAGPVHAGRPTAGMWDVVETPAGFTAVGATCQDASHCRGAIWTSPDGNDWTLAAELLDGLPAAAAVDPSGQLVVAGRATGATVSDAVGPAVWLPGGTPGEIEWSRDIVADTTDAALLSAFGLDAGVLVGGDPGAGPASVWGWSGSGSSWVPQAVEVFDADVVLGFGGADGLDIAVGSTSDATRRPIWVSSATEEP